MNKLFSLQLAALAAFAGLISEALAVDDLDQSEFPQLTAQPTDQDIQEGSNTVLTVQATNVDSYQWLRNGVTIDGQTNSSLALENIGTNDAGLYSCNISKGSQVVPTRVAALNVFILSPGGPITVYGTPFPGGGSQGSCPGAYAGYVNYTKTVSQGWGWAPSTGTTTHTASDGTTRTDTKVQYLGKTGDKGCALKSVTAPDPAPSAKYRFTIYFPNNVPTNSYPLVLSGFDP
jgi:hypothetical protein